MLPARNLLRRHYDNYGGWLGDFQQEKPCLRSNPMAEKPSWPNDGNLEEEQGEAGISSKETDAWLQLGIGHHSTAPITSTQRLTELELFSDRPQQSPPLPAAAAALMDVMPPTINMLPENGLGYRPWGYWNQNQMMAVVSPPQPLQYNLRRFPCPPEIPGHPVREMRVVSPSRRPQAGVWFFLQAAQNQEKEPFLPQIPRTFLRIKDERMTVRLLMKYLVRKLGLYDESEVEITCRGQLLHPSLRLQHVRDNIWRLRAAVELIPDSHMLDDHLMIIQYNRSST